MADKKWILPAADTSGPIQDGSTKMVLSINENKEVELKAKKLNKRQIWSRDTEDENSDSFGLAVVNDETVLYLTAESDDSLSTGTLNIFLKFIYRQTKARVTHFM